MASKKRKRRQRPLVITASLNTWPKRIDKWYKRQLLAIDLLFQNKENYLFRSDEKRDFIRNQVTNYLPLIK